jgi:Ca-activated chloride channel family protein
VKVGLTGFAIPSEKQRPPVNVALVLDKSGSMQGEKIAKAREAAISALDRLRSDDIVSVITYDTTVTVLVPATKLTDKAAVRQAIAGIEAGGNTALFAGVSKGAAEIRKFLDLERVNRVILLSDGLANEGPSSPADLGNLGASLKKESITVSTLGLGLDYNEDLMVQLAARSGGNHQFIQRVAELADVFNREFEDVTSVVAQDVKIKISIPEGIRPVRVLGNDAEISGQQILINLSQIYEQQDKHVVLELEVPATATGNSRQLATVVAAYRNMKSGQVDQLTGLVSVNFSDSQAEVDASLNPRVMEDVVALVANEQSKLATDFLDAGDLLKCRSTLSSNGAFLREHAEKLDSVRLRGIYQSNGIQLEAIEQNEVNRARKGMRFLQNALDAQQELKAPDAP